jgi:epsilon-lactone hydrolase
MSQLEQSIGERSRLEQSPLEQVMAHLRHIATLTKQSGGNLYAKRQLIELYGAVDRSVSAVDADLKPALAGDVVAEWVLADGANTNNRILYIHGGSWLAGSPASHRPMVARIAKATGCVVLSVAYRLAPEHPYPAGLDDCVAAYQWLRQNDPQGNRAADNIFIVGDSAGGNLALASLLFCKDNNITLPNAAIALSPATDLTLSSESLISRRDVDPIINPDSLPLIKQLYVPDSESELNPYISPIYGDLTGLPPILLQTGEAEVLVDDSVRFHTVAQSHGVATELDLWPDMPHIFQGFAPLLPQASQAIKRIAAFVETHKNE